MTPRDWNEMKKLLTDVADQKTVQEILEKVSGNSTEHAVNMAVGGIYSGNTTVLSVEGKGRLYCAIANLEQVSGFKIMIDGETIFHVKSKIADADSRCYVDCGVISRSQLLETYAGEMNMAITNSGGTETHNVVSKYGKTVFSTLSSETRAYTGSGRNNSNIEFADHVVINNYLIFHQSLTVMIEGGNQIKATAVYSLGE